MLAPTRAGRAGYDEPPSSSAGRGLLLTKLTVRNYKRFKQAEIELDSTVLFVGPNNSGKTSAMQAPALRDVGLKRWNEKRSGKKTPEKRSQQTWV